MKAYRILVPTDFSSCSESALSFAIVLAGAADQASICLLHVVEASVPGYDDNLGVLEPEFLRTQMQMLSASRRTDIAMETKIVHGDPRKKIVATAKQLDIDLIVIGTHGRGGLAQFIMGSTAKAVLHNASCPVMTVRDNSVVPAQYIETQ
jgi:nucleotide-binding universal stress UspA family protein